MSERYWITGVQIGVLKTVLDGTLPKEHAIEIIKNIEDNQFIGNVKSEKDKIIIL